MSKVMSRIIPLLPMHGQQAGQALGQACIEITCASTFLLAVPCWYKMDGSSWGKVRPSVTKYGQAGSPWFMGKRAPLLLPGPYIMQLSTMGKAGITSICFNDRPEPAG